MNLNAPAKDGIRSTAAENASDMKIAKISGLFCSGLNLKRDSVFECRLPAWTSFAAMREANAMVWPSDSAAAASPENISRPIFFPRIKATNVMAPIITPW